MSTITRNALLFVASLSFVACSDNKSRTTTPPITVPPTAVQVLNGIDTTGAVQGIVTLPATAPAVLTDVFERYSHITYAGAGATTGRVHFLTQSGVSDEAHFRARRVLEQQLADVPGSILGADKSAVRSAFAASNSAFVMFRDVASSDPTLPEVAAFAAAFPGYGQLVATESIIEGSSGYAAASPVIDDTLSSTARFVLDAGGASMAAFRSELATRAADAQTASLYTPDPMTTSAEGDFLERTLQVWFGVWGHDPRGDGRAGDTDTYAFVTRAGMEAGDPSTVTLLSAFFPAFHSYPAFLVDGFVGTFETTFDPMLPYTHRSRYLTRVGLRGASGARINGNALDGTYIGGEGDDAFDGRGGNDIISGGAAGTDSVFFTGASTEYNISVSPLGLDATQIQDLIPNRDGVDQVRSITNLVFTDMTIQL